MSSWLDCNARYLVRQVGSPRACVRPQTRGSSDDKQPSLVHGSRPDGTDPGVTPFATRNENRSEHNNEPTPFKGSRFLSRSLKLHGSCRFCTRPESLLQDASKKNHALLLHSKLFFCENLAADEFHRPSVFVLLWIMRVSLQQHHLTAYELQRRQTSAV